jgi:hypothetical protein
MKITLYVPGLLLPSEILESTVYDLRAPQLSRWLGQGTRQELLGDWLPSAFGLDRVPAAAVRKLGAPQGLPSVVGVTAPGEWLCLDPVRWQVAAQGVTLDDPARLALSAAESAALCTALAPLFAEWGALGTSAPGCWELQLQRPLALTTQPLAEAIQQPIDPRLPSGADGPVWRRLLVEAQTQLHAHPVNRAREDAGQPTVNSLWPWGQGALPEHCASDFKVVWSADPVLAGLCRLSGAACQPLPARFTTPPGEVLVHLETLAAPLRALDALAWRAALLDLERDWLAPALAALQRGECSALALIGAPPGGPPAAVAWTLKRSDLLRFWRKPPPLTSLK